MIHAVACAKINLSLRVGRRQSSGLHRIDGLFQSVAWVDHLLVVPDPAEDQLGPWGREGGPGAVVDGWDNLAWRALDAVRKSAGSQQPLSLSLHKEIPTAAGLGGGSADAAAALAAGARIFGMPNSELLEIAARLGSDVPFCLTGGTARVRGTGSDLDRLPFAGGFALGVVVPPIELATGAVYAKWDELQGPTGPAVVSRELPPSLRAFEELANDLLPAAVAMAPALDEWRAELAAGWGRPVLLTGSGPSLFGFFVDEWEAAAALDVIPPGARASAVAVPVPYGWALRIADGAVAAPVRLDTDQEARLAGLFAAGPGGAEGS